MTTRTAFIAVTHLLGVGHLARMAALGRALVAEGWRVVLASGGRPNATVSNGGCEFIQLPPVHCVGADFSTLLRPDGTVADSLYLAERARLLVEAFDGAMPDVLITELYPFGRRSLRGEFDALLRQAHLRTPRPAVLCSIRDVLNPPSRPEKADTAFACLTAFYDGVLFHGDDEVVPLTASWPASPALMRRVKSSGYLHDSARLSDDGGADGREEIVVSGGGSAAGLPLCRAAVAAAICVPDRRWRLLVGQGVRDVDFADLGATASMNMVVERARPDFPLLLTRSALSISQAGYNTVLDLAAAGARALLVPYAEGGEREQTIRAEELERRGLARVIPATQADGERLAAAAIERLDRPRPDWSIIGRDGARRTAGIIGQEADKAAARASSLRRLDQVLARAEAAGRTLSFWWRDDDAVRPTRELDRLLDRCSGRAIPISLATIAAQATPELARHVASLHSIDILVHGFSHLNHASRSEKKAEFGAHRPGATMAAEAAEGLSRVRDLFGERFVPIFVPPWNRIADNVVKALPGCGYVGLSTYNRRAERLASPGLVQINTHLDPIAWRSGGGLADEAMLYDRLTDLIEDELASAPGELEPIGLLTHHLVHDGWIDRFLDELLDRLLASKQVRFLSVREILSAELPSHQATRR